MRAASQLPGRGPTDVDDGPLHLHVNQKSDYDMIYELLYCLESQNKGADQTADLF